MFLLFVDGLGLGEALEGLFPLLLKLNPLPLDATLGVEGLPQSGTGQTSLLTGVNAAQALGRHQGPFPAPSLRPLLRQSLYAWARAQGLKVLHANGYRPEYLKRATEGKRLGLSAFALAARLAGLPLLPLDHPLALPPAFWPDPKAVAQKALWLLAEHDLVVLEYWALDLAAHRAPETLPERFRELAGFLEALLEARARVLLVSDHGNAEEPWHPHHTRNPVPLAYTGRLPFQPRDLTGVVSLVQAIIASKYLNPDRNT